MTDYASIHQPVLLEQCVSLVAPALQDPGSIVVDCTLGQRVERSNPPESFKGLPITLVSAAITAMSFMGFGGLVENIIAALM